MLVRRRLVVRSWPWNSLLLVVERLAFVLGQLDRVVLAGIVEFGLVSARAGRAAGLDRADIGLGNGKLRNRGLQFGVVSSWSWNVILVGQGGTFLLSEDAGLGVEGSQFVAVLLRAGPRQQFLLVLYF